MACHQFHAKDMDWWKKESFSKYQMHLVGLCMSSTFSPSKNPKKTVLCHHFHGISWSNHLPILTLPFFFVTRYSSTKAEFKGQSADTSEVSLGGRSFFGWMKNPHGAMEIFFGLESRLGGGFLGRFGPCGVFGCEAKLFWELQKLTTKFSGDVFFFVFFVRHRIHQQIYFSSIGIDTRSVFWRSFNARFLWILWGFLNQHHLKPDGEVFRLGVKGSSTLTSSFRKTIHEKCVFSRVASTINNPSSKPNPQPRSF